MKPNTEELADFTTDSRVILISAIAIVIGGIGAFVAWVLIRLISLFTNLAFFGRFSMQEASPAAASLGPWVIAVPVIGGLIIGLMARYGSEKIRGHGIPEALEAILIGRSRMEAKVALLKPLSSAISIGTGGPFGAEGPIIMTGGAVGSLIAQVMHLSSAERKTLLVAGAAAGMSAVFSTPIAAALLAVELLLFEWKPRSFIPVALAAATASAVRVPILGAGPIFPFERHPVLSGEVLGFSLLAGLAVGFGSGLLTTLVYAAEDLFSRLKFHWMWWPAIGGLFVGIGGLIEPRALGVGYDVIGDLLNGKLVGTAIVSLLVVKALVWSLSLGSGTSGGVLAPLLMIGGALGALGARVIPVGDAGLWALVSMTALMGGTMRAPITAIIFALELTYDIHTLPALLIAAVASQAVTVLIMKRSILTEKVARRGHHLTREYTVDPLEIHRVSEVMLESFETVRADTPARLLANRRSKACRTFIRQQGAPVVGTDGKLLGVLTVGDLMRAMEMDPSGARTAMEACSADPIVAYPDEVLRDAVIKMVANDIGRLPVVERQENGRLVGYLDRTQLMKARMRWYEEENIREGHLKLDLQRDDRSARTAPMSDATD
ncbi:MAG: chloride channel protein [Fimbriimonadaceae bacterium]|nr:chloride channel protein [Fimbriimonadaceae bacterium]